jgi:hypothetical protein
LKNVFCVIFTLNLGETWLGCVTEGLVSIVGEVFLFSLLWLGSIVAFTKVVAMCHIYCTWIHYHHCSLSSPPPDSWNSFNSYHYFCIYIHVYTLFTSYSSSCLFPCHLSSPTVATSPALIGQNLFIPPVLWFCRIKIIKDKKRNMMFLLVWDEDSYKGRFLVLLLGIYIYSNSNWFTVQEWI